MIVMCSSYILISSSAVSEQNTPNVPNPSMLSMRKGYERVFYSKVRCPRGADLGQAYGQNSQYVHLADRGLQRSAVHPALPTMKMFGIQLSGNDSFSVFPSVLVPHLGFLQAATYCMALEIPF